MKQIFNRTSKTTPKKKSNSQVVPFYDLTTEKGLEIAQKYLSALLPEVNLLIKGLVTLIQKHQEGQELQKQIACDLIKKGKDEGVDEMEIKINNMKGFSLNIPAEGFSIDTKLGSDDTISLKVKYK